MITKTTNPRRYHTLFVKPCFVEQKTHTLKTNGMKIPILITGMGGYSVTSAYKPPGTVFDFPWPNNMESKNPVLF